MQSPFNNCHSPFSTTFSEIGAFLSLQGVNGTLEHACELPSRRKHKTRKNSCVNHLTRTIKASRLHKDYPFAPDKFSRQTHHYRMLLLLRSLNELALGTKIKESQQVQVFYRNLERGVLLKVGRCVKTRRKTWIKKSSMQPRNVQSFVPEIVSYKQKQRDDVSVGRIQRFFSG